MAWFNSVDSYDPDIAVKSNDGKIYKIVQLVAVIALVVAVAVEILGIFGSFRWGLSLTDLWE